MTDHSDYRFLIDAEFPEDHSRMAVRIRSTMDADAPASDDDDVQDFIESLSKGQSPDPLVVSSTEDLQRYLYAFEDGSIWEDAHEGALSEAHYAFNRRLKVENSSRSIRTALDVGDDQALHDHLAANPDAMRVGPEATSGHDPTLHNAKSDAHLALLIEHGADVNVTANEDYGRTLLHRLALGSVPQNNRDADYRESMMKTLIAHGADVNARDVNGQTPLHLSSERSIGAMLLDHGADAFATNNHGVMPSNPMAAQVREEHVLRELASSHRAKPFPSMDQAESYAAEKRAREPASTEPASDIAPRRARRLV